MKKMKKNQALVTYPLILRGRSFSKADVSAIGSLVKRFREHGRTRISEEICKAFNWRQPNGWLKDRACRDVLARLHRANLITLPKAKVDVGAGNRSRSKTVRLASSTQQPVMISKLDGSLFLEMAKGDAREVEWNRLVRTFHYLGHTVIVGRCLKFLVRSGETLLGAASLSDPAWAVANRDTTLARWGIERSEVANNSRFLILPHIKVKNLASQALSLLATEGVRQWANYYGQELKCLETFVDSSRFIGTSYLAANWVQVGYSRGYKKAGATHANSQTRKAVFLYPIDARHREGLRLTSERRSKGEP